MDSEQQTYDEIKPEAFEFLEQLRSSGQVNMWGAAPYVAEEFEIDIKMARNLFTEWTKSFS